MDSTFYIDLHIKTPQGFETFGRFYLGDDREEATSVFDQLAGTSEISERSVLHMDFTELQDGVPLPIRLLHCTLDDIAENSRVITRDVFRNLALRAD
jgi:hypothetical protein